MAENDPTPKLRIIEEQEETPAESVVRLGGGKTEKAPAQRLQQDPVPAVRPVHEAPATTPEAAARLESVAREHFEGRSVEPGVEAIFEQQAAAATVEQPWGGEEKRVSGIPYGWFVLIGLLVISGGVWSLLKMKEGEKKVAIAHGTVREKVEKDEQDEAVARELVDEVESVVRSYLAADTQEKILPLVRQPERVRPLIEKAWQTRPKKAVKFVRMRMFQPALLDGKPFWVVRAEVEDGPAENLLLEQTGDAGVKVDWETHVSYQPIPWEDYIANRAADQSFDFRIYVTPDNFYSHEFADSSKWRCFRLTTKDSAEHLFGYVAADSEAARFLAEACAHAPRGTTAAILRLRRLPESGSPRGVVIEKIVAPRWVHVTEPADAP
jgi:hypothetical protein